MSLTSPPVAPTIADPSTFATRADAMVSWLGTNVTELNALQTDVSSKQSLAAQSVIDAATQVTLATAQKTLAQDQANTAIAQAILAQGSAASVGVPAWVSGTTYAIGNLRYSPVNFQNYRRKTAGAGTTDPSLDQTNWVIVGSAYTNQVQSSATSIVLTASSASVQSITFTAASQTVTMPAANSNSFVGPVILIRNSGLFSFDILNNAGDTIFSGLGPNKSVVMWLRDNTTVAGEWSSLSNQGPQTEYVAGIASVMSGVLSNLTSSINLDSTRVLVFYSVAAGYYAVVLSVSGLTVTVGTPVKMPSNGYAMSCCAGGANQVLYATSCIEIGAVTVSGTVPSFGPPAISQALTGCYSITISPAGTGKAIVAYPDSTASYAVNTFVVTYDSSNSINACGLNISDAVNQNFCTYDTCNIGTDAALHVYISNGVLYGYVVTCSGAVLTRNATYTLVAANVGSRVKITYIGSNQAMICYNDTSAGSAIAMVISISGTVLTPNAPATVATLASPQDYTPVIAPFASASGSYLGAITYGNGVYVVVPRGWSSTYAGYSYDGVTWTGGPSALPSNTWYSVAYDSVNAKFIAVGDSCAAYSTDGITWIASTISANPWRNITCGGGKCIATAMSGSTYAYSPDGVNWTTYTNLPAGSYRGVAYGNGYFVMTATSATTVSAYSTNGTTWTVGGAMPSGNYWDNLTYGNGKFVAVAGMSSSANAAAYSTDNGLNWIAATMPATKQWSGVTYGNGVFLAIMVDTTTSAIAYSINGTTWSALQLSAAYQWSSVCFANGNFYAVRGNNSTSNVNGLVIIPATVVPTAMCSTNTGSALVCYNDGLYNSGYLKAMTVSGTTITVGAATTATNAFNNTLRYYNAQVLCQTNTNKAAFVYMPTASTIFARTISVSGTAITYNTESAAPIYAPATTVLSICQTNTDEAVIGYMASSMNPIAIPVSTSATTATFPSSIINTSATSCYWVGVTPTAATGGFVILYKNSSSNSIYGNACTITAGTITGGAQNTTVSYGAAYLGTPQAPNGWLQTSYLSPGKALMYAHNVASTSSTGPSYGSLIRASGLTFTTPTTYYYSGVTGSSTYYNLSSCFMATDTAVLSCSTATNTSAVVATASGYSLSFGGILSAYTTSIYSRIKYLSSNKFLWICYDSAGSRNSIVTASGTTLTNNTPILGPSLYSSLYDWDVVVNSPTKQTVIYRDNEVGVSTYSINVSGNILSLTSPVKLNSTTNTLVSAAPVGNNTVVVYQTAGIGYAQIAQFIKE